MAAADPRGSAAMVVLADRYVDHRRHPMFFSERNGYRRGLHIGPHCLMVVKP